MKQNISWCVPHGWRLAADPGSTAFGRSPRLKIGVICKELLQTRLPEVGTHSAEPHATVAALKESRIGDPRIPEDAIRVDSQSTMSYKIPNWRKLRYLSGLPQWNQFLGTEELVFGPLIAEFYNKMLTRFPETLCAGDVKTR